MATIFTSKSEFFPSGADTARSATAQADLGSTASDKLGNEYVYIKAGADIAAKDAVTFNGSALGYDDVRSTSAAAQTVLGAATAAFTAATNPYGYIMRRGVTPVKVVVGTAAGSSLVTNATSGTLALAQATDIAYRPAMALVTGVAAGSSVALM